MTRPWVGELVFFAESTIGVPGGDGERTLNSADELFEHTRTDALGRYRPLSGARTLPRGWRFTAVDVATLGAALEAIYPLALAHSDQHHEGTLRVIGLDEVLTRQSGRYENASALSEVGRVRAIETICGECVRRPVWNDAPCSLQEIPCPEPCSVLVAFCREAALWESQPPAPAPPDTTVAWAAFEEPGNELRERYLSEMDARD